MPVAASRFILFAVCILSSQGLLGAQTNSASMVVPGYKTSAHGAETESGKHILEKLNSIIIDKFNFEGYDLTAILPYLTKRSKELDPDHIGVKFALEGPYAPPVPPVGQPIHREVTFSLNDIPLIEVLDYVCQFTNHDWRIENGAVIVFPAKK